MTQTAASSVRQILWHSRRGWQLSNGVIEVSVLEGGGHIAEFRSLESSGPNLLWKAPWDTIDPDTYDFRKHGALYGPAAVGRFLAGFTGHALCLDLFGMPSEEEAAQGAALHGEAPVVRWNAQPCAFGLRMRAELPKAGLSVERELLLRDAPVLYVSETVSNQREQERAIHWVQHVTLGPPLLAAGESMVSIPGARAKTWPLGYDGKSLVRDDTEFAWPKLGEIDLSQPFQRSGSGMVLATLPDPARAHQFIAALNWGLGLAFVYCFRDFPWVAVWEENQARQDPPWNGRTQARGLEFGTTPMPLGKSGIFDMGQLFGTPTWLTLPGHAEKTMQYAAFVARVPHAWREIRDVEVASDSIILHGRGENVEVSAPGIGAWLR